MATARKSDLGHEEERTLWLNKAGDLSHYDERRGFIWLCLQVTSHGDEPPMREGRGEGPGVVCRADAMWAPLKLKSCTPSSKWAHLSILTFAPHGSQQSLNRLCLIA